ncbi:MAG TPA: nicotinate-nucleotide adenylyltransferase [Acidimicrobiales bacterium]|nr:nicotinate-nucleotide adenylyltransferase [Acidimicrobiales bacterium]
MPLRVGVFGGTFDPPQVGHVRAAVLAKQRADLDTVLWVVAKDPWQKAGEVRTSAEDRFAMVRACVAALDGHQASRIELDRPGPSYTIDTLEQLRAEGSASEIHLIVGQDVADTLDSWHRADDVADLCKLLVVDRDPRDVSSTEVRRRLDAGEPIDDLVPLPVMREIAERGLYSRTR